MEITLTQLCKAMPYATYRNRQKYLKWLNQAMKRYDINTPMRVAHFLAQVAWESGNLKYDSRNNCNAIIETATNTLIVGCKTTVIPESVTEIHDFAFNGCRDLTSVEIPDSVSKIGGWAFNGCRDLTSVEIPDSVEWIGPCAFSGTPWERNRRKEPTKK